MNKFVIPALLASALALTACGKKEEQATEAPAAETAAPAETTAPAETSAHAAPAAQEAAPAAEESKEEAPKQ